MNEKSENELSNIIIGCAIEVHKQLGLGFVRISISRMSVI